ncbi:MAG: NHL repeat-containing protein [Ferruginibacter sp.]|nr:NHL repeat-containing protein [Ferruginibacter sp.]
MKNLYAFTISLILLCTRIQGQIITTVAGNGMYGYSGDGDSATWAKIWSPASVAVNSSGNLYICEQSNDRIRKVDANGIISTVAGDGTHGYGGDGGLATLAHLNGPTGVAVDLFGNIFIADGGNNRIRKVTANGIITTVAGNGSFGSSGDGSDALSAALNNPRGVTVDPNGNLYIADYGNNRIRKVTSDGIITTIAGNGTPGYNGDNGSATLAKLNGPNATAVDALGNVYIADANNYCIRKVGTTGIITTIAGNGTLGVSGEGGPATSAQLTRTECVAVDGSGNLYIADSYYGHIQKVDTLGIITSYAGNVSKETGDGGPATSAHLQSPTGVTVDKYGNVYIAERGSERVRKIGTFSICYWNGNVSSVWENPANWNCGILPSANTKVFIDKGPVILKSNTTVWSLTIAPNVSITIASPFNLNILH